MRAPFPYFGGKRDIADAVWQQLGSPKQSDVLPVQATNDLGDVRLLHAKLPRKVDLPVVSGCVESADLAHVVLVQLRHPMSGAVYRRALGGLDRPDTGTRSLGANNGRDATLLELASVLSEMVCHGYQAEVVQRVVGGDAVAVVDDQARRDRPVRLLPNNLSARSPSVRLGDFHPSPEVALLVGPDPNVANDSAWCTHAKQYNMKNAGAT